MPFLEPFEKVPCFKISKRLGRPMLFGWTIYGWSQFGENIEACAVYQQRRRRLGTWTWYEKITTKPENFYMKPTWPENPQYEEQQAWRGVFADAISAWQALTAEQKEVYNKAATRRGRRGYNRFISQYLKSN